MEGAKCTISKLMYGLFVCTDVNQTLKLMAYRLVHTDEPYINLHLNKTTYPVFEPRREKTGFLHMRKQTRRSASR